MNCRLISVIAACSALLTSSPVSAQDTIVVHANNAPVWGLNARFVRELRIGVVEGADEYMFGSISSVAVAPDGNIFVLDGKANRVREYDARGRYIRSFGRRGAGPGEIGGGGSIAIMRDQLVVLDTRNARLNIYPRAGGEPKHYSVRSAHRLLADTLGRVILPLSTREAEPLRAWRFDVLRERADTLTLPWVEPAGGTVQVIRQQNGRFQSAEASVPFSREVIWSYSRFGEIIGGNNDRYVLDRVLSNGRVLRIVRSTAGIPVSADEQRYRTSALEKAIHFLDKNYRYNGPRLPSTKPVFAEIFADYDGRLWLTRALASVRLRDPATGEWEWRENFVHDVIARDGKFVGTVRLPDTFHVYHATGNHVWGVEKDDLGVQYIARYQIVR